MKGDLTTKILLVIVLLLLVFNLIKSKGSENIAWGEPGRTVVAGAAIVGPRMANPTIYRFWSDGAVDVTSVYSPAWRMMDPWETLHLLKSEKKSRR